MKTENISDFSQCKSMTNMQTIILNKKLGFYLHLSIVYTSVRNIIPTY